MSEDVSSRSGRRKRKKAVASCRKGEHRYGGAQGVGGGITRRVCLACGEVTIDLRGAEEPEPAASEEQSER